MLSLVGAFVYGIQTLPLWAKSCSFGLAIHIWNCCHISMSNNDLPFKTSPFTWKQHVGNWHVFVTTLQLQVPQRSILLWSSYLQFYVPSQADSLCQRPRDKTIFSLISTVLKYLYDVCKELNRKMFPFYELFYLSNVTGFGKVGE